MRFVKRCAVLVATVCIAAFPVEAFAAGLLFRLYARKKAALWPTGSATLFLSRKVFRLDPRPVYAADPPCLFRPDQVLGYAAIPGRYRITIRANGQTYESHVTIQEDGLRATSYRRVTAARRFHLFGNSFIWGAALEDEQTVPWLLQNRLPDYEVVNRGLNGYTAVHQLLLWRALRDQARPDDIVFFSYLRDELRVNIGDTRVLRERVNGVEATLSDSATFAANVQFPFATLTEQGALVIRRRCLISFRDAGAAERPDPASRIPVTIRIFDELVRGNACHVVVGFFSGDDDDPVIAHLRSLDVTIADLRVARDAPNAEDFLFDRFHRGAFAHHRFQAVIYDTLTKAGALECGAALQRPPEADHRLSYKIIS